MDILHYSSLTPAFKNSTLFDTNYNDMHSLGKNDGLVHWRYLHFEQILEIKETSIFLYTRIYYISLTGLPNSVKKSISKISEWKKTKTNLFVMCTHPIALLFIDQELKGDFFFGFYVSAFLLSCILCPPLSHYFITPVRKRTHSFYLTSHFNRISFRRATSSLIEKLHFLGGFAKGSSPSSALSICHPTHIGNPITYKGIRKVLPDESIYPMPIVVWKSKILRVVLFQELLFKTMQCLFGVEKIRVWIGLKK